MRRDKTIKSLLQSYFSTPSRIAKFKLALGAGIFCFAILSCSNKLPDNSRIYFFGDLIGPGVNIFSTNLNRELHQHTADLGSRDISISLDESGNIAFSSNRVLDKKQKKTSRPSAVKTGNPQDFNVYLLAQDTLELEDQHLATVVAKSEYPETQANLSPNGKWLSFVRTVIEPKGKNYEELYIISVAGTTPKKIATNDLIIKTAWSKDSTHLLYSEHNYTHKKASLTLYDSSTETNHTLLTLDDKNVQIDSPQWSPDQKLISYIEHPLNTNTTRQLFILNLQSKKTTRVSKAKTQVQAPVSWAQDSKSIVYSALVNYRQYWHDQYRKKMYEGGAHIFLTDLAGKNEQLTQGETQMHRQPVFSPDNTLIAYMYSEAAPGNKASLRIMDTNGTLIDTLYDQVSGAGYLIWK